MYKSVSHLRRGRTLQVGLLAGLLIVLIGQASAQSTAIPPVKIDTDGTVRLPPLSVPVSEFLSPQGKTYVAEHLEEMQNPKALAPTSGTPDFLAGYLKRDHELFPVDQKDVTIGGVPAIVFTPKTGVSAQNRDRVLIELHGGAFMGCWPACARLESLPIAALGHIKVIAVDYRESPEHRFPAASEDVATVYRELLKSHAPKDIGIYGCSAGGMLTGESIAWLQAHHLPMPGAVGMFCAGLTLASNGFGGDAGYFAPPLGDGHMPIPPQPGKHSGLPYFQGSDVSGPMISVAHYPKILAKFPPSLIITATRDFAMSSAVYTHTELVNAGASSELHVWEGMFHGFFYDPDVPESRDCYKVIVRFFARHLGSKT